MIIQKTSLHAEHLLLNGKMAPFAGFDMPLQYTSVKEEVQAVRSKLGIFDVSHMGEFLVEGSDAVNFVDFIITNDFKNAPNLKAVYSPLCRDNGTIIDDLIAYKLADDKVLICVNASNINKDWDWINSQVTNFKCTLKNQSDDYSLIAVQGPLSEKILREMGLLPDGEFPYYSILETTFETEKIIIARTGYTGEDGFEIFCTHAFAKLAWKNLISLGAVPCGLAARDVLRLEVCYPLYGHELNDEITPLDAGLAWTVKLSKNSFIGKSALTNYKPRHQLVKLSLERGIPRADYQVLDSNFNPIGIITSGTMSVVTGKGIAMALILKDKNPSDKKYFINIRNNNYEAQLHTSAFIKGGHK